MDQDERLTSQSSTARSLRSMRSPILSMSTRSQDPSSTSRA